MGIIVGCAVAAILLFCCVSLTSCCAYRLWSQSKRGKRRVKPADDDLENQNPHGFGSNGEHQPLISVQERGDGPTIIKLPFIITLLFLYEIDGQSHSEKSLYSHV